MTISRDSAIWWAGMIAAVITGLALNLDAFPWISETARHWITLGAAVVGIISGKLATSPLPSHREAAVQEAAKVQHKINMRKVGKPLIILALLLGGWSCAKTPPNLTPAAVAAFHGTQIIHDLDRVRDAADAAHKTVPPLLSAQTTLQVVTWHKTAITIVHEAKDGWRAAVRASLDEMTAKLSPADRQVIGPYVAVVKSLLTEVTQ